MSTQDGGWQPISTLPEWPGVCDLWLCNKPGRHVWKQHFHDWHRGTHSMILARGYATHWQPEVAPAPPGSEE